MINDANGLGHMICICVQHLLGRYSGYMQCMSEEKLCQILGVALGMARQISGVASSASATAGQNFLQNKIKFN